jgi:glycosyltransferase involved in cell wall biosynthesis
VTSPLTARPDETATLVPARPHLTSTPARIALVLLRVPRERPGGGLRIAYLVTEYPRTSHSFIRREIHAQEALGNEIRRFSLRPLDEELVDPADVREVPLTRIVLDAGVVRHALAVLATALGDPARFARALALAVRLGWRSERGLLRHFAYLAEAAVLARWLRQDDVDHLHAHFGTNSAAVALLCHALGGPTSSFAVHGSELDRAAALALGEKIRHAAFTVAISSYGRAQLCRYARDEDWPRIHVVHTGLDEALLRAPRVAVPAAPRLVCVARLVRLKGHAVLLEAAARLASEGLEFELVLAGDGPHRPSIVELIRAHRLERHVTLAGWMGSDQVRDAIQRSRALVLPSLSEGLPVVIMEALALGRPVIASAISAIPELVEPGVTGWLVPAGSVEPLVSAMRAALTATPGRLAEMGQAGAALVAQRHDAVREARRLAELIRGAVRPGGAPPDVAGDAVQRS